MNPLFSFDQSCSVAFLTFPLRFFLCTVSKRGGRGRGRGRGGREPREQLTAEELDKQLDDYVSKTDE